MTTLSCFYIIVRLTHKTSLQAAVLLIQGTTHKEQRSHDARQRLLTNMTKQWQTQSDQRDGIIQINAYSFIRLQLSVN